MSFNNIKQLAKGTSTISINGVEEEVKLLTVREKEQYDNIVNEGFGTIQANLGRNTTQQANMNIQRVTSSQYKADRFLIKTTYKDEKISDEDIDNLYNIYKELVSELKRVNGIITTDDETVIQALQNETENNIKKQ